MTTHLELVFLAKTNQKMHSTQKLVKDHHFANMNALMFLKKPKLIQAA
jgi:hypothetical protein